VIAATDASGSASSINSYDAYGSPATTNAGRIQYTGQMWLAELGLYQYKARMYAPGLGRFMQSDPIGYDAGMNLYAYVGGDPVNYLDPTGLKLVWICDANGKCELRDDGTGPPRPGDCGTPERPCDGEDLTVTARRKPQTADFGDLKLNNPGIERFQQFEPQKDNKQVAPKPLQGWCRLGEVSGQAGKIAGGISAGLRTAALIPNPLSPELLFGSAFTAGIGGVATVTSIVINWANSCPTR
jgi:RHS repeat-associated protein